MRPAKLHKEEMPFVEAIFEVFDCIGFNPDGEFVATFETELPVIGQVTVSYYVKESHIKVYRDNHDFLNTTIFGVVNEEEDGENKTYFDWMERTILIRKIKDELKKQMEAA